MQSNSDFHEHPAKRCAKCLTPMTDPDWIVNKEMAYCIECANLLHLGESKESRMFSDMHDPVPEGGSEPAPGFSGGRRGLPGDAPALPDPGPEDLANSEEYGLP